MATSRGGAAAATWESPRRRVDADVRASRYRKDRAAAWGGVAPKTTTDASATKTSSNDDEVKAGKEEKTSKAGASKTETTKTTSAAPLEDAVAHIVDLDVARYIELAYVSPRGASFVTNRRGRELENFVEARRGAAAGATWIFLGEDESRASGTCSRPRGTRTSSSATRSRRTRRRSPSPRATAPTPCPCSSVLSSFSA